MSREEGAAEHTCRSRSPRTESSAASHCRIAPDGLLTASISGGPGSLNRCAHSCLSWRSCMRPAAVPRTLSCFSLLTSFSVLTSSCCQFFLQECTTACTLRLHSALCHMFQMGALCQQLASMLDVQAWRIRGRRFTRLVGCAPSCMCVRLSCSMLLLRAVPPEGAHEAAPASLYLHRVLTLSWLCYHGEPSLLPIIHFLSVPRQGACIRSYLSAPEQRYSRLDTRA